MKPDAPESRPADRHAFGILAREHHRGLLAYARDQLVRVALKGREMVRTEWAPANLVFLLDVSGSMNDPRKLPLVVEAFQYLLEEVNASDTVSIVVYAGSEGLALPPTSCNESGRRKIESALRNLRAGGSTNGGAGIKLAYRLAKENFKEGGINRVILGTDGDFNVGVTEDGGLVKMVEKKAKSGIFLTVLGFGTGNLNAGMMEAITNKGDGAYHYIDTAKEARRVFLEKLMGTLVTIAKDVKLRYKQPEGGPSTLMVHPFIGVPRELDDADADFRFATLVAMAGMLLRETEGTERSGYGDVRELAAGALGADPHGRRAEFVNLVKRLGDTRRR